MSNECDVLIVGGGPAGLVAARVAAERGADVLLLEKNTYLGSPFSRTMWDSPYMRRVFKAIGTSSVRTPLLGYRAYDLNDEEYIDFPAKGWGGHHVDAVKFCQGLARLAAEEGARFEVSKKVTEFLWEGDTVVGARTSKEKFKSKVVLCADGLASIHVGLAKGLLESPYPEEMSSGVAGSFATPRSPIT